MFQFFFQVGKILIQNQSCRLFGKMCCQQMRKKLKITRNLSFGFYIFVIQNTTHLDHKITTIIHQFPPKFSPFPPTVIGCIGPKNQKQRQYKPKQRMYHSNINDRRFGRQMQILYFQIIDSVRISSNEQHCWEKDAQRITFMETDEYFEEIFCVVSAHTKTFVDKDN